MTSKPSNVTNAWDGLKMFLTFPFIALLGAAFDERIDPRVKGMGTLEWVSVAYLAFCAFLGLVTSALTGLPWLVVTPAVHLALASLAAFTLTFLIRRKPA